MIRTRNIAKNERGYTLIEMLLVMGLTNTHLPRHRRRLTRRLGYPPRDH